MGWKKTHFEKFKAREEKQNKFACKQISHAYKWNQKKKSIKKGGEVEGAEKMITDSNIKINRQKGYVQFIGKFRYFNSQGKIKWKTLRKIKLEETYFIWFLCADKLFCDPTLCEKLIFFFLVISEGVKVKDKLLILFNLLDLCCFKTFFNDFRHIPEIRDEKIKMEMMK